jgi:hypothetical protein
MGAAKNEAHAGEDKPDRVMVRIKSNIGPSGGGFGYCALAELGTCQRWQNMFRLRDCRGWCRWNWLKV